MKVFWCNSFLGSQVQATTLKCKWKCLLLLIRNQIQEYFNQIRKYLIQLACCYNMKGGSIMDHVYWIIQIEFACVVPYRFQVILTLKLFLSISHVSWMGKFSKFPFSFPNIALLLTTFFCSYVISNTPAVTAIYGLASVSQQIIKCDVLPPTTGCSNSAFLLYSTLNVSKLQVHSSYSILKVILLDNDV